MAEEPRRTVASWISCRIEAKALAVRESPPCEFPSPEGALTCNSRVTNDRRQPTSNVRRIGSSH
jgi:hypothetical protein